MTNETVEYLVRTQSCSRERALSTNKDKKRAKDHHETCKEIANYLVSEYVKCTYHSPFWQRSVSYHHRRMHLIRFARYCLLSWLLQQGQNRFWTEWDEGSTERMNDIRTKISQPPQKHFPLFSLHFVSVIDATWTWAFPWLFQRLF